MKVTFVENNNGIAFDDLAIGEVFTENSDFTEVYMKVEEFSNEFEVVNAICLNRGATLHFAPNVKLRPLEAELVVCDY